MILWQAPLLTYYCVSATDSCERVTQHPSGPTHTDLCSIVNWINSSCSENLNSKLWDNYRRLLLKWRLVPFTQAHGKLRWVCCVSNPCEENSVNEMTGLTLRWISKGATWPFLIAVCCAALKRHRSPSRKEDDNCNNLVREFQITFGKELVLHLEKALNFRFKDCLHKVIICTNILNAHTQR